MIAVYGRRPTYREPFARYGFAAEAAARARAWATNDAAQAMKMVTGEMVDAFSATGPPDEVAAKIDVLGRSGLDEVVLYVYGTDGDAKRAVADTIEAIHR